MRFSILAMATVASAAAVNLAERAFGASYPYIQVLPVPGINTTTDEIDNLASVYASSAKQIYAQAYTLSQSGTAVGGPGLLTLNYDFKAGISLSLVAINNIFWQTATTAQRKVCAITTSINQQNVNNISASLSASLSAEAEAVKFLITVLLSTVASIRAQIALFAQSERDVIRALILAIFTAAVAAVEPLATLSAGLSTSGNTGLNAAVQGLSQAVSGIQAATNLNYQIS